jgi:hypothetical protein
MMRPSLRFILIAICAVSLLFPVSGCKKGENDPFLSLLSRKQRITGSWTVVTGDGTKTEQIDINGDLFTQTETWDFDGADNTIVRTNDFGTTNWIYPTTYTYTFNKDNSFKTKVVKTYTALQDGEDYTETVTMEGSWQFAGGDDDDTPKKSQVLLEISKETTVLTCTGCSNTSNTYSGSHSPMILMDIDKLKNKEMVLKWEGEISVTGNSGSESGQYELLKN